MLRPNHKEATYDDHIYEEYMKRVVMAMSGGVDSSVAAYLLKKQGYEVIGITMQLWNHNEQENTSGQKKFGSCCSISDVNDARIVADQIGIPHYVVNFEEEFKKGVVDYFAGEYAKGRTPNPCVMCNSQLKFDHLIAKADALGADYVATGHYAKVEVDPDNKSVKLFKARDPLKDQSYFLFHTRPDMLARALFPLADLDKPQVREIAKEIGLRTADKKDSQEICFVANGRYSDFLQKHYPEVTNIAGDIVDEQGQKLGTHTGIHLFTVGQRKGLPIQSSVPRYVSDINAKTGTVTVSLSGDLKTQIFEVENINWLDDELSKLNIDEISREISVAVRYRANPVLCTVSRQSSSWLVTLMAPVKWVTPGQAAVFYDGERCVGGGFIKRIQKEQITG